MAQKKEVAKHIFEREPGRSANSVAQEVGLAPQTAQKVQDEVISNLKNSNKNGARPSVESLAGDGIAEPVIGTPGEEMPPAPAPERERFEASGRRARGRKPLSPEEKAARADARAVAKAEARTKLKPLTSARDDEIDHVAQQIGGNLRILPDIIQVIASYDGLIQRQFTFAQRHELVTISLI